MMKFNQHCSDENSKLNWATLSLSHRAQRLVLEERNGHEDAVDDHSHDADQHHAYLQIGGGQIRIHVSSKSNGLNEYCTISTMTAVPAAILL